MSMSQKKKATVIVFSVFIGILVGLVIASNFNLTQNGFAINESKTSNSTNEMVEPINSDLESTSRAFVEIAKRVTPTVVSITSEKVVKVQDPFSNFFHNDDFFRRFFRMPDGGEREYTQRGLGSGVIVSSDGYILTNYHVIKDADEVNVVMDKDEYDAEIVGTDPETDIAVIKIDESNLRPATIGNSDNLEVGEWVLAVGNPFDISLQHTVTSGIISAKGRALNLSRDLTYQDFIQTDAAINPGNSGGALVNIKGELIGINTAIYAGNAGGNVGIGFAIPINLAKRVMDDLISTGKVVRGYLGVMISTPDDELSQALKLRENRGAVVNEVVKDTPADKAGLKKYDVIIEVDGQEVEDSRMLTNLIASYDPKSKVELKIVRDGKIINKTVQLEERPGAGREPTFASQNSVLNKLGLEVTELTDRLAERFGYQNEEGVVITNVLRNSPAGEKGLQEGDLIVEVDRQKVSSVRELEAIVEKLKAGDIVLFQVQRQGANQFVAMKVPQ